MKKYANAILKNLTTALELVIAALLAAGIIIMTAQLILSFGNLTDLNTYPNYDDLLTTCFNLIIGVEMIRMLYLHTPMTVSKSCCSRLQDRSLSTTPLLSTPCSV